MTAREPAAIKLRVATVDDLGVLLAFVRELAAYEKSSDAVVATEDDLRLYGFGPERRFEALLAFVDDQPAGCALFFPNFSTWRGRPGLYLEDIFVSEWARGLGVGRRLMARLAAIAVERGCARLDFTVLDWNPARSFYHRLGVETRAEWLLYRATGEVLSSLAAQDVRDDD